MKNVKEHGLWAWYRKPVPERLGISIMGETRILGAHAKNIENEKEDELEIPDKFLVHAYDHDHHEDTDWVV